MVGHYGMPVEDIYAGGPGGHRERPEGPLTDGYGRPLPPTFGTPGQRVPLDQNDGIVGFEPWLMDDDPTNDNPGGEPQVDLWDMLKKYQAGDPTAFNANGSPKVRQASMDEWDDGPGGALADTGDTGANHRNWANAIIAKGIARPEDYEHVLEEIDRTGDFAYEAGKVRTFGPGGSRNSYDINDPRMRAEAEAASRGGDAVDDERQALQDWLAQQDPDTVPAHLGGNRSRPGQPNTSGGPGGRPTGPLPQIPGQNYPRNTGAEATQAQLQQLLAAIQGINAQPDVDPGQIDDATPPPIQVGGENLSPAIDDTLMDLMDGSDSLNLGGRFQELLDGLRTGSTDRLGIESALQRLMQDAEGPDPLAFETNKLIRDTDMSGPDALEQRMLALADRDDPLAPHIRQLLSEGVEPGQMEERLMQLAAQDDSLAPHIQQLLSEGATAGDAESRLMDLSRREDPLAGRMDEMFDRGDPLGMEGRMRELLDRTQGGGVNSKRLQTRLEAARENLTGGQTGAMSDLKAILADQNLMGSGVAGDATSRTLEPLQRAYLGEVREAELTESERADEAEFEALAQAMGWNKQEQDAMRANLGLASDRDLGLGQERLSAAGKAGDLAESRLDRRLDTATLASDRDLGIRESQTAAAREAGQLGEQRGRRRLDTANMASDRDLAVTGERRGALEAAGTRNAELGRRRLDALGLAGQRQDSRAAQRQAAVDAGAKHTKDVTDQQLTALTQATGWSQDQINTRLAGAKTAQERQQMFADIGIQQLEQNRLWNQFIAEFGLEREQVAEQIRAGRISQLTPIIQMFQQLISQSRGGYV